MSCRILTSFRAVESAFFNLINLCLGLAISVVEGRAELLCRVACGSPDECTFVREVL